MFQEQMVAENEKRDKPRWAAGPTKGLSAKDYGQLSVNQPIRGH